MVEPRHRPKTARGPTHKIVTGCGNLYVTINKDEEGFCEVFAHLGKTGQCGAAQIEAICRAISIGLRAGVGIEFYAKQLSNIRCSIPKMWPEEEKVLSCGDGISQALRIEIEREKERSEVVEQLVKRIEAKEVTSLDEVELDRNIEKEG